MRNESAVIPALLASLLRLAQPACDDSRSGRARLRCLTSLLLKICRAVKGWRARLAATPRPANPAGDSRALRLMSPPPWRPTPNRFGQTTSEPLALIGEVATEDLEQSRSLECLQSAGRLHRASRTSCHQVRPCTDASASKYVERHFSDTAGGRSHETMAHLVGTHPLQFEVSLLKPLRQPRDAPRPHP